MRRAVLGLDLAQLGEVVVFTRDRVRGVTVQRDFKLEVIPHFRRYKADRDGVISDVRLFVVNALDTLKLAELRHLLALRHIRLARHAIRKARDSKTRDREQY